MKFVANYMNQGVQEQDLIFLVFFGVADEINRLGCFVLCITGGFSAFSGSFHLSH
jgi:hypothetical protein